RKAAGGVLTAKQAPHRPGTAPALGLRAGCVVTPIVEQTHLREEISMLFRSLLERFGPRTQSRPPARVKFRPRTCGLAVETLEDRCVPAALISIGDVSVVEGNSGTLNAAVPVTISQPHGNNVTVNYSTANGTATAGSDYNAVSGTLTFTK